MRSRFSVVENVFPSRCHIVFLRSVRRLLVTANVVPSSPVLVILMMETIRSSETSALTRAARRHIPEDYILHSYGRENLKSYIALTGWTLKRRSNVFPLRYELGISIPEDGILLSELRFWFLSIFRCCNY
jgi:hypothetical protein